MSCVAVIPARGGSRRIPNKNRREFRGKPIIAYSIEAAQASGLFDHVVVSTDDHQIAEIAYIHGAWALPRSPELSRDEIGTQDVTRSVILEIMKHGIKPMYACCIYPCAPLLNPVHLIQASEAVRRKGILYAVSVGSWLRDPGQFYFGRVAAFLTNAPLLDSHTFMIPIGADRDCDINTESDWSRAEAMYAALHPEAA